MALGNSYMLFNGQKVRVKVVEPEGDIKHRVFVLSSPLISAFNWRKITPELSQLGCLTVMLDMPGFGDSEPAMGIPGDTRVLSNIAWGVVDQMDMEMGSQSSWHLIGHGSACRVILDMANLFPDSVKSQVYISPQLGGGSAIRGGLFKSRWYSENIVNPVGYRRFMDSLFARPADDYVIEIMRELLMAPGIGENLMQTLSRDARLIPIRGFIPAMAIWGERDILMDRRAQAALQKLVPEAETHILKTAGFMPMETHSHALRDYIRGWLKYVDEG